jgi:hypothetical protein
MADDYDKIDVGALKRIYAKIEPLIVAGKWDYTAFSGICEEVLQASDNDWEPLENVILYAEEGWAERFSAGQ